MFLTLIDLKKLKPGLEKDFLPLYFGWFLTKKSSEGLRKAGQAFLEELGNHKAFKKELRHCRWRGVGGWGQLALFVSPSCWARDHCSQSTGGGMGLTWYRQRPLWVVDAPWVMGEAFARHLPSHRTLPPALCSPSALSQPGSRPLTPS